MLPALPGKPGLPGQESYHTREFGPGISSLKVPQRMLVQVAVDLTWRQPSCGVGGLPRVEAFLDTVHRLPRAM